MTVLRSTALRTLLAAPGRPLLYRPLRTAPVLPPPGSFTGPYPASIAGISGWWDAGAPTSLLDGLGNALADFGGSVAGVIDKSGSGNPLAVFHAGSGAAPVATPRVAGLLGGVGLSTITPPNVPSSGTLLPLMDGDNGLSLAAKQMGSGAAWTRYLVWTRPNWRQGGGDPGYIDLIVSGGTPILRADSQGSPSRLILFPGASQTVLTTTLERRHTHAIILRNTPGSGVDVWIDGQRTAIGATNPLAAASSGQLLLLHSGTTGKGAQCWFHEAAAWERALSATEIATLISCSTRWPLGARRGVALLPIGQSNAGNALNDGAWHMLAQGIAWHVGAAAWNVIGKYGSSGAATCVAGHGLYGGSESAFGGSFLTYQAGVDPSTWMLGQDGTGVEAFASGQSADTGDICAILLPWSETDSIRPYSEKSLYTGAARRFLAQLRIYLGKTPTALPVLWWNPIPFPYGNAGGMQMMREAIADIAADTSQNVVIAMPQTSDSNQRGSTWNPSTGASSGGDSLHRDAPDNIGFARRASVVAARAIAAAGLSDSVPSIPAALPLQGGPGIVSAQLATPISVVVTIAHDAGTDLRVPLQAAAGAGFAVMDGGSVGTPGPIVQAIACARTTATTLTLTLASAVTSPGANCLLFYPYGSAQIGRGNAVTDNYSAIAKPAAWDIGHDLGSAWTADCPLAATSYPVQMT